MSQAFTTQRAHEAVNGRAIPGFCYSLDSKEFYCFAVIIGVIFAVARAFCIPSLFASTPTLPRRDAGYDGFEAGWLQKCEPV